MQPKTCYLLVTLSLFLYILSCYSQVCMRNSDPELLRKQQLEAIKQEILLRLDGRAPPVGYNSNATNYVNQSLLDDYLAVKKAQELINKDRIPCVEEPRIEKKRIPFFPIEISPPANSSGEGIIIERIRLKFLIDLENVTLFSNAELRLYRELRHGFVSSEDDQEDRVEVFLITTPDNYYGQEKHSHIDGLFVDASEGYVDFDVTDIIKNKWSDIFGTDTKGEITLDVLLRCPEALNDIGFAPNIQFRRDASTIQFVITTYQQEIKELGSRRKKQIRSQINTEYCKSNPDTRKCCFRELEVNFRRDLNITWVVDPPSFQPNYCSGNCPSTWGHATEHSWFVSLLLQHNPTASPTPCCVPNSYAPFEMLTLNATGDMEILILEDLQVKSCICR